MGAIYVNDRNLPKTSLNDVWSYINSLAPTPPLGIIPENNGYKIQFNDETQCNIRFQQHVIWDLQYKNMTASLSEDLKNDREIYVPNPPDNIYDMPVDMLVREIHKA